MTENTSQQSEFYDSAYQDNNMPSAGFPDLKIVDYKNNVDGKKILSIGGGNGSDLWFLANNNEVYLVDGSAVATEQAADHGLRANTNNVEDRLIFDDNFFDIVVLKDILEHIYNPINLLKEAKRVLKSNGYLIVSVPNHFYLPFRLRILFGGNMIWKTLLHNHKKSFDEWDYMHIRFFTWSGFKKMMTKAGVKIEKAYWDFGTLAHYSDPLMYERAFKINNKKIITKKQWLMYKIFLPVYKIFNIIFPKKLRSLIVSVCPSLFCAGFYVKVKKIVYEKRNNSFK